MAPYPRVLFRGPLRSVASTATTPRQRRWVLTSFVAHNAGTTASMFRLTLDGALLWEVNLPAGATYDVDTKQVLMSGQVLAATADGINVTLTASGVEDSQAELQIRDLPTVASKISDLPTTYTSIYALEGATR